jgi:hypothetical protein
MSVKSVEDAVTGFFGHHIGDLNNIASVLGSLVTALPIDPQTKEHIGGVIGEIKTSALTPLELTEEKPNA